MNRYSPRLNPRVLYYADDDNIPEKMREQNRFLSAARNVLLDQIAVSTLEIMKLKRENDELLSKVGELMQ